MPKGITEARPKIGELRSVEAKVRCTYFSRSQEAKGAKMNVPTPDPHTEIPAAMWVLEGK